MTITVRPSRLAANSAPPPNRAEGMITARFRQVGGRTALDRVHEAGGLRLRFPNVGRGMFPDLEAVCINTGGGMVGGDRADYRFTAEASAAVTVTTQSAEKIYRAEGEATSVRVGLDLEAGATLEWLPQETILYDTVGLRREMNVVMAEDARLLLAETLVFGRLAMGETVRIGHLHDRWRVRRGGRLIFAEDLRLDGEIAAGLDRPAVAAGGRALATVLLVAPGAERALETVRSSLAQASAEAAASAWDGLLVVRALSPSPDRLRATILPVLETLRARAAPRVWQ